MLQRRSYAAYLNHRALKLRLDLQTPFHFKNSIYFFHYVRWYKVKVGRERDNGGRFSITETS